MSRGRALLALLFAGPAAVLAGAWAQEVAADAVLRAPAPTAVVLDRGGRFLTEVGHRTGGRVEYGYWQADPPARVVATLLALEDRRFFGHPGIDPVGVARAALAHLRGGRSGASTVAMQVARMQHPRPRTLWAKAVEAGTGVVLTLRYGHAAVLAQYLRLAPYGGGSHGVGHAAWRYFDKPATDLSWAEAALVSAIPQSPSRNGLRRPGGLARAAVRARRALLATEMPAAERAQALRELDGVVLTPAVRRPEVAMHAVLRLAGMAPDAVANPADPRLRATLDLGVQEEMTALLRLQLAGWRGAGAQQAAVMVVRRGDGAVLADVGSAGWRSRPAGAMDFSAALRSPGSTLKPFLYAAGLDRGLLSPAEVMQDAPEVAAGISNADDAFLGALLPRQALANSRNVPAAGLLNRMGVAEGMAVLRRAGLTEEGGTGARYGLGLAIGAMPTRLDWLVQAYRALSQDGVATGLRWFQGEPPGPSVPVASRRSARLVAAFLSDPMARLPAFPRYGPSEYPFAVALKTGTSQGYRDSWTVAWSADYVVGAWMGRPDAGPTAGLSGARAAARLVQAALLQLHGTGRTDLRAGAFAAPVGQAVSEVCTETGRPGACAQRLLEFTNAGGDVVEAASMEAASMGAGAVEAAAVAGRALAIVEPGPDAHVWRNPDAPPGLQKLALRAQVSPGVRQVVWLVDGAPAWVGPADQPYRWPMTPGVHRFQLRLPLEDVRSRQVRVVVE